MSIWRGLRGPENRKWGKSVCFTKLFKGRGPNEEFISGGLGVVLMSKQWCFSLKMLCVYFQNCVSCIGGEHNFRNFLKGMAGKWKIEPRELRWQVKWVYEGAWGAWEPKMWKKCLVYNTFLRVAGPTGSSYPKAWGSFWRPKSDVFRSKCFVAIFRIVLPAWAGSTIWWH